MESKSTVPDPPGTDPNDSYCKFAVYVVVVEDSELADMELAGVVESLDRVEGGMTYETAEGLMVEVAGR